MKRLNRLLRLKECWLAYLFGGAVLLCAVTAQAQDYSKGEHGVGHAQFHPIYQSWRRPDDPTASCCSNQDCRPTSERMVGDHYEAMVDGVFVRVPPSKILHVRSPDGRAHVCAPNNGLREILCFLPKPET